METPHISDGRGTSAEGPTPPYIPQIRRYQDWLAERHGLKLIDDLRGRYTGQTDDVIYQDAYDKYWARCTKDRIMLMGGHVGAVRMPAMADWGVREKMFFHDLSANPKHTKELALNRRLLSEVEPGGYVFGWHSYGKDTEEQYTTLLSTYGLRMEGLHNLPNLSFNCQFTFTAAPPDGNYVAGWGTTVLGGAYLESISGLHKQVLQVGGTFRMRRISEIASIDLTAP